MAKNSQKTSAKTQKVRRQKQTLAVLGALFLVLLVVQVPRTLKKLNGDSATPAAPATTAAPATAGSGTPASPISAVTATAATAGSAPLQDSDVAPKRARSQLLSFEHFKSKDPFVQQVSEETAPTAAPTASSPTAGAAPVAAASTGGASVATSSYSTVTAATPNARRAGNLAAAVVVVNGEREFVAVQQAFPRANPTFKLVSLTNGVARIGLAGGTYASGAPTVALRLGRTLTLVNTADGMRYELRLVSAP